MPSTLHYQLREASHTPVPINHFHSKNCHSCFCPVSPHSVSEVPGLPVKEQVARASSLSPCDPGHGDLQTMTPAPAPVSTTPRAVSRCSATSSPAGPSCRAVTNSSWTWGSAGRIANGHRRTASRTRALKMTLSRRQRRGGGGAVCSRRPTAWPPDPAPEWRAPCGEEPDAAGFPGLGRRGSSCASRGTPGRGGRRSGRYCRWRRRGSRRVRCPGRCRGWCASSRWWVRGPWCVLSCDEMSRPRSLVVGGGQTGVEVLR